MDASQRQRLVVAPSLLAADFSRASQLLKITVLRRMIDQAGRTVRRAVDGGVEPDIARLARAAGADTLIAGTAVFGRPDYAAAIAALREGAAT